VAALAYNPEILFDWWQDLTVLYQYIHIMLLLTLILLKLNAHDPNFCDRVCMPTVVKSCRDPGLFYSSHFLPTSPILKNTRFDYCSVTLLVRPSLDTLASDITDDP
jgi:hypothetical protein